MRCKVLKYTNHAVEFMAKRGIEEREVEDVVRNGEVVEEYLSDKPFASRLMFALVNGRPLHLVVGFDDVEEICFVITAYEPNTEKFEADFKTRKRK
ncbi:MAG: DUF4258 domain-containing protein [Chitinophagales bacterium]|nr:DUF4258 domain-containing protein [Chitinophagales bacterium]